MVNIKSDLIASLTTHANKALVSIYIFCIGLLISTFTYAGDSLEASVDRNKLYLNESFNLKLTGSIEVDFSFGGLISFGMNQLEAPEIEGLENDFELLDRQQNYSMRSINGNTTTEVTWNYTLSPKRAGKLIIPPALLKSAQSKSIDIEVLEGKAPINADNPPSIFIEIETDKNEVYVQEQVQYTVRLFSLGRLSSGNLSEPITNDAIIEPFGDERKYYRMAYNQRYEVIERKYLIFPQKSGILEIPGLSFNGTMIDSYKRRRVRVAEMSDRMTINVAPPNPAYKGKHWLPAKSLHISENWQNNGDEFKVGDAITREITINALGLLGSALPPIPETDISSVKTYPDKALVESNLHEAGSQALRKEATTYIAIKEGAITLPEVRIDWWDTINNVSRIVTLPEKVINIVAATTMPQREKTPSNIDLVRNDTSNLSENVPNISSSSSETINEDNNHSLFVIIALLALGWLSTSWFLLQKLKQNSLDLVRLSKQQNNEPSQSSLSFKQVIEAVKSSSTDMPKLVISWFRDQGNDTEFKPSSIKDLYTIDPDVSSQLEAFEEQLYGKANDTNFDSALLIKKLKEYQNSRNKGVSDKNIQLKPFYPQ